MREKVSTAYFLDDPRKFSSMEEAEKELNRLRAVCVRLKKKQGEDIAFMLGLSVTDSQYMGKMGYQKSMRLHPEVTEFSTIAKRTGLSRNTVKKHYGMVAAVLGRK